MSMLLPLVFLLILIFLTDRKFKNMQPEKQPTLSEIINQEKIKKQNRCNENAKIEECRRFVENETKEN